MKTTIFSTLLLAAGILTSNSLSHAQVTETPVVVALTEGGNPQGYIQNTNDQGILFATTPGGRGNPIPYTKIRGEGLDKLIRFEERVEVLGEPRALFSAGEYAAAAAAFGKVARDYKIILSAPQNFATEALFYQAESFKRAGNYKQLATVVNAPVAKTIETKLSELYQRPYEFLKLWALFGEEKMDELKASLDAYQEPIIGDLKLLGTANFKKGLPPAEIAQLAFLRAKVTEAGGDKQAALDDYYRCFTLAYGNDELLAKLAMGATMVIQKEDPRLESKGDSATAHMQSVAYMFAKRFGKDGMPAQFQEYAVRPPMAKLVAEAEKPAEGEGDAEAKPAEGEAPADGEKPAEGEKPDAGAKEEGGEKKAE